MATFEFYSGIGSRETPEHIQRLMTEIAEILERRKFILRSGGAEGADLAFERGVHRYKEIFYTTGYKINDGDMQPYPKNDWGFATTMFKKYHPSKGNVRSPKSVNLLTRNTFQIFGIGDTMNSSFVLCYTPDGAETYTTYDTGGTGQAIRIANDYNIPVYNLKNYIGVKANEMVEFILKELKDAEG